jgi:hypothetical protein
MVMIPASVISIGDHAFQDCMDLTAVMIPASVTAIGTHSFSGCEALTEVTIPASVTSIFQSFNDCTSLVSLKSAVSPELLLALLILPQCKAPQDHHRRIVSYIWQPEWIPGPNMAVHPDVFKGCSALKLTPHQRLSPFWPMRSGLPAKQPQQ